MRQAITEIIGVGEAPPDRAMSQMPKDFAEGVHESVSNAISSRLRLLEAAVAEL
jgi:serine/threonine-protein kinase HipA